VLWTALVVLIHLAFIARAILRSHREPASRLAWVVVMIALRLRQDAYLAQSRPVTADDVARWSRTRRLWNNTIAMLSPVL
jgi:hypothetical protein